MRQPLRRRRRREAAEGADDQRAPAEPSTGASRTWDRLPPSPQVAPPLEIEADGLVIDPEPVLATVAAPDPLVAGLDATASTPRGGDGPDPDQADADKQAAYAAWAERMRGHKKSKLAGLTPDPSETDGKRPPSSPYWDASALFSSTADDRPTDPALMATRDLLGVLELTDGADSDDLQAAYRRLAKEHHPDRWHDSAPDVRSEHETRMALITEAHRELKRRGL